MAPQVDVVIDDQFDDKDPWPEPPVRAVWSGLTPQQWAAHTRAFEPLGHADVDGAPLLTVVSAKE